MTLASLTDHQLDIIRAYKPLLLRAAESCGIPWQMLAAVWYRETSLICQTNAFQFDPLPAKDVMIGMLQAHCDLAPGAKASVLGGAFSDFFSCAVLAACWLCHKCRFDLATVHTEEAVADAFYGYNGRAYGSDPLNSPYVANELDDHHHDMHFRGTINGKWESITDLRPGALTVYRQLIGAACTIAPIAIYSADSVEAEQHSVPGNAGVAGSAGGTEC